MIYQHRRFTCGPAALHNALNFLYGKGAPSEDSLSQMAGTTVDGTGHKQMKLALKTIGVSFKTHSFKSANKAYDTLWNDSTGMSAKATIVYCNKREHWVVVVSAGHSGAIVVDSADADLIVRWSKTQLMDEWGNGTDGLTHRYYSIVIGK